MNKLFAFATLMMVVLSACGSPVPVSTEVPVQISNPSTAVPPTDIPRTVAPTPTVGPQQYYTEEFDQDPKDWSLVYMPPDTTLSNEPIDKLSAVIEDGLLKFDIDAKFIGAFGAYDPFEYKDVRVDARVENHGDNTNDVAIMCRYSGAGWYEFNILSSGLYYFNYISITEDGLTHITTITDGGSNKIKQDVNEYGILCQGDTISMYINGEKAKEIKDSHLTSGKVAVQGFSLNRLPVKLYFDWVKISQP